jgi:parallel beta-helix repeat protein
MIHNHNNLQPNSQIFLVLVLLFSLFGFYSVNAAGLTYYVNKTNPSCSDTSSGTNSALPFCTINKGASVAAAGDTVQVLAGNYAETVTVPKSGSAGLPITYSAAPGVMVAGNGKASGGNAFRVSSKNYIIINGFTITGTADRGIYVSGSNNITLSNNHVSYSGKPVSGSIRQGIYLTSTSNSTISGNTTDYNSSHGIYLTGGSYNNLVSNNLTFGNAQGYVRDASGIRLDGSGTTNNTILHNISYGNEDSGITNYTGAYGNFEIGNLLFGNGDHGIDDLNSPNNTIIGNTVQGNVTAGINFEGTSSPGSGGATVINNIMVDNGLRQQVGGGISAGQPGNLRFDSTSLVSNTLDYNIFYLNSGTALIQWNGINYSTLAAFQAAAPGKEIYGLQANPLFSAPAPVAQRPAVAPFNITVNVGNYHLKVGSPAMDSANSNAPSEALLDLDGNARFDNPATTNTGTGVRTYDDRGVYEFQPVGGASTATATLQLPTSTATNTPLPTVMATAQLPTFTPTNTLLPTATATLQLPTSTATNTPLPTVTATTQLLTFTPTNTLLPTATVTLQLPTSTATNTPLPTVTAATQLPTFTPITTFTPTPTTVSSSPVTFIANADSYVHEGSTSNYGTNTQLWMDGDIGLSYEAYLKFSVVGMTGTIQNATLRVYSTSSTVDGPTVYATTNAWTETGINWNTRPALTSSGLDDKGMIATGVWIEYNVTAQITGDGIYCFAFVPTSTDAVSFSAREGSQPPQLIITFAP